MMQLFSLLKQVLKGDVHIDVNEGIMTHRGVRVVAVPVPAVVLTLLEIANLFGEASVIFFERVGEGVGSSLKETMGWRDGGEALREIPNIMKVGGFGKMSIREDWVHMENLPTSLEDSALLAYLRGFFRGMCIELEDAQASGNSLRARFKQIC